MSASDGSRGHSVYELIKEAITVDVATDLFAEHLAIEACEAAGALDQGQREAVLNRVWPRLALAAVAYLRAAQHGRHSGPDSRPTNRTYDEILGTISKAALQLAEAAEELMHQALEPENRGEHLDVGRWKALQELSFALNVSQFPDDLIVFADQATAPLLTLSPYHPSWGRTGFEAAMVLHRTADKIRRDVKRGGLYAGDKAQGRTADPDRLAFILDLASTFASLKPDTTFGTAPGSSASGTRSTELGRFIEAVFKILEREKIFEQRLSRHARPSLMTIHRYLAPLRARE